MTKLLLRALLLSWCLSLEGSHSEEFLHLELLVLKLLVFLSVFAVAVAVAVAVFGCGPTGRVGLSVLQTVQIIAPRKDLCQFSCVRKAARQRGIMVEGRLVLSKHAARIRAAL